MVAPLTDSVAVCVGQIVTELAINVGVDVTLTVAVVELEHVPISPVMV